MAQHLTNAQIQTILAKTVGNCKPYELHAIIASLEKTNAVQGPDNGSSGNAAGAEEVILSTTFPSGSQQW